MAAGAIVSGAFFGDKMSPLSDTTNLAPAIANVSIFDHIRHMLWTTIPSLLITLSIFVVLGLQLDKKTESFLQMTSLLTALKNHFPITLWTLLSPLLILVLATRRVKPIPTLVLGLIAAVMTTSMAVNNAFAKGILPVVAAGNSGPVRYTVGSSAAAKNALTVGAFADIGERGFHVTDFSSRGPTKDNRIKPDIMATGYQIIAPYTNSENQYIAYSGTSMATPFVAGVAALMLDANESLTPLDLKTKITSTAQDWGPTGQDIDYGYGRL